MLSHKTYATTTFNCEPKSIKIDIYTYNTDPTFADKVFWVRIECGGELSIPNILVSMTWLVNDLNNV